jgi:hypothetical protein
MEIKLIVRFFLKCKLFFFVSRLSFTHITINKTKASSQMNKNFIYKISFNASEKRKQKKSHVFFLTRSDKYNHGQAKKEL